MCFVYDWLRRNNLSFQTNRRIFDIVVLGLAALIVGVRNNTVGVDTFTYEIIYEQAIALSWKEI